MSTILSIELSDSDAEKLRVQASRLGVSLELLATTAVVDLLAREEADFQAAAKFVLEKNQELYKRLG
jgi:predicted transcriptional regulator